MYNRDRFMRKLLGKPAADASSDSTLGVTSSPAPAAYRPIAAQNAVYNAGVPIASLDKSPDGRSAIIAGRHILRVVRLDGLSWNDVTDLRGIITTQQATSKTSSSGSTSDQLSIKDVKWAQGQGDTSIFTACANGKIFQYDLARLGGAADGGPFEFIQTREDSRQVNTLDINPHRGTYLLSGSQDGIVRCFDIRSPVRTQTGHLTFRAVQAFKCNADGVRHVKWSPKDGFYFASATEQGILLKWDIRKATAPILRINAHEKACATIAWHQDGEHLISGGWDNRCQVWDVSSKADKRQKAKWTIMTPAPVAAVAWRPGQWSATAQGKRAAQVAITYDDSSQMRHGIRACQIWDLARPTLPFKEIQNFNNPPASLLWHDQDLLWTAGHDGLLNQFDIAFAPKVIDRTAMSTMSFSSRGEVLMFLDERPPARRPRPHAVQNDSVPHSPYSSSPTTPMLSISRSDSEDEVVGSFLGARRKPPKKRRYGARSANVVSTTPPGGPDEPIMALEQSLKATGFFKTQQGMAIGPVPSATKVHVYHYLSVHYLETLNELLRYHEGGKPMVERVLAILEHYAEAAEHVSHFRLAQTWRILAYAINLLLTRRAQYHVLCRRKKVGRLVSSDLRDVDRSQLSSRPTPPAMQYLSVEGGSSALRRVPSGTSLDTHGTARSLLSEEIESTSNVPTPVARPVDDHNAEGDNEDFAYIPGKKLTPVSEADSFSLPPAAHPHHFTDSRRRLDSEPLSTISHDSEQTHASTEGYDFYDMDVLAKAIDVPGPRKQEPPAVDYIEPRSPSAKRKPVLRHDSDESFAQMFSISSGSRRTTGLTESPDSSFRHQPSRIHSVPEHDNESGSGSTSTDFASRIRGKEMSQSPEFPKLRALPKPLLQRSPTEVTEDDDRMITQTTADSLDSDRGESHPKPDAYPSESPESQLRPLIPKTVSDTVEDDEAEIVSETPIETDYLPWPGDPPYPYPLDTDSQRIANNPSPLQPYTLLSRALAFESRSSALNASAMILLLKPLVPEDLIDSFQASAILRQHHSRLMGMKLFIEAALLRKLCIKGWPGEPLQDWGDNYPAIFRSAQEGVSAGFMCSKCRKPREVDPKNPGAIWRCDRCRTVLGPCAVCGHRDVTENLVDPSAPNGTSDEEPIMTTWWYCAGCGHGGHATCLQGWHSAFADAAAGQGPDDDDEYSDGCCPLDGCGHACLPGKWRAESTVARTEEVARVVRENARAKAAAAPPSPLVQDGTNGHERRRSGFAAGSADSVLSSVHGDGNEVPQSRAVEIVRETLAAAAAATAGGGSPAAAARGSTGVLGSSPGRMGGERERRKSVKFARTEDGR
ncbi:WD domain-containing protein [Pleurostoma richardsiae]|uniref:WD domain-containing protein n=1 Tax=Pleurostoma richardsiae TaxID=41990 RepID=A0AA38VBU1_9PEZI|nr:WD domain-containing protein [Pleurostoma richardsiae]